MAEYDIGQTTTPTVIRDYIVANQSTEGASPDGLTRHYNSNWTKWYGIYKATNKIKASFKAYATWIVGLGREKEDPILDNMTGWGKDNFDEILWNMLVVRMIGENAYAHIVRNPETGTQINLKPLDVESMVNVVNKEGTLEFYEQISNIKGKGVKRFEVNEIFHLCNERIADNITGDSLIESLVWNIEAQEEARRMHRKKVKNSGIIGILEIDVDDPTKITTLKEPVKKGIEEGMFLMVPKDIIGMKDFAVRLNTQELIQWLNYLDDEYYQMIGLPKIIGGASGEIEGDSKMSYLAFKPRYMKAINNLTQSIWNQMARRVKFRLPPSIEKELAGNEQKNASQTGFQANDTTAGVGV